MQSIHTMALNIFILEVFLKENTIKLKLEDIK